ncbi:MAG: heme A synthase [Balneolaceae bacterium]|nr:heme A synthase [Balneolaceae bacterium]
MNTSYNRLVYYWLWSGVILIVLMAVIGGITRLTDSGLSMSDWSLIMGAIPPLNEAEWMKAFTRYQEFPQFQQQNFDMQLHEFKGIFYWEYFHRLLGRLNGLIFLVPFLYFWIKGAFDSSLLKRMFILLGLGVMQGAMGWIMVKSGLVDVPYVSHYRLALHLILAMVIIGCCLWFALDLKYGLEPSLQEAASFSINSWLIWIGILFIAQILYGAFTAGMDAGVIYNTFPQMGGKWIPPSFSTLDPFILNLIENPGTIQWMHRLLGTLLLIAVGMFWIRGVTGSTSKLLHALSGILLCLIVLQYALGIYTLLQSVPVSLGVFHQLAAIIFWICYLIIFNRSVKSASY